MSVKGLSYPTGSSPLILRLVFGVTSLFGYLTLVLESQLELPF